MPLLRDSAAARLNRLTRVSLADAAFQVLHEVFVHVVPRFVERVKGRVHDKVGRGRALALAKRVLVIFLQHRELLLER